MTDRKMTRKIEVLNTDKLIDKHQLCPCCFKKYREKYAVDFNGVSLRASNLKSICGDFSSAYNLIRLNKSCLKRHVETMDGVISHELEHATIFQIMLSFGFSAKISSIGCLCVSSPSKFDVKDLKKSLRKKESKNV